MKAKKDNENSRTRVYFSINGILLVLFTGTEVTQQILINGYMNKVVYELAECIVPESSKQSPRPSLLGTSL